MELRIAVTPVNLRSEVVNCHSDRQAAATPPTRPAGKATGFRVHNTFRETAARVSLRIHGCVRRCVLFGQRGRRGLSELAIPICRKEKNENPAYR